MAIAGEPPPNLARLVAKREAETQAERDQHMYRQSLLIEELDPKRSDIRLFREEKEIVFSPAGERWERPIGKPSSTLKRLQLTPEDFRDIYEVQSLLITPDQLFLYETKPKGEELIDGVDCWVMQVRPRQILEGQRLFDGMLWVDKRDYSVIRSEGKPVPQIHSAVPGKENLFPSFTTLREKIGSHWFPVTTVADETLAFHNGPLRTRTTIRYRGYKRFGAESKVTFDP